MNDETTHIATAAASHCPPTGCGLPCGYDCNGACFEASATAAENARLRTALAETRAALKPFSDATQWIEPEHDDDYSPSWAEFFAVGDFRKAATALSPAPTKGDDA